MAKACLPKLKGFLRRNLLTILTVAGVVVGIALGFGLRASRDEPWPAREIMYVQYVGDIFLRMLQSLILPLIVSSMVSAIGSLDLSLSGKIGGRAIVYYFGTTICAVILGIALVSGIHPGETLDSNTDAGESPVTRNITTEDSLMDLLRNMFPPNLIQATISHYQTALEKPNENETDILKWDIKGKYEDGTNMLGMIIFAAVMGVTLGKMGEKGRPLLGVFTCLSEAMMIITGWVIWLSPIGILFLVTAKLLEIDDMREVIGQLGKYFGTVLLGLVIHGFVVLPLIFTIFTRTLPFRYLANMSQAIATAFGTSSSSASLPVTIACLEEKNNIDERVSRFVLPIGSTINMDGTALYEAVAAIFVAQVRQVDLSFGNLVAISITATAASIGAAGIPQAGLVTLVMVLNTVGLPPKDVSLIIAVDWLLDRFRTMINVLGDSIGAGIVHHLSKKELERSSGAHKEDAKNGEVISPDPEQPEGD